MAANGNDLLARYQTPIIAECSETPGRVSAFTSQLPWLPSPTALSQFRASERLNDGCTSETRPGSGIGARRSRRVDRFRVRGSRVGRRKRLPHLIETRRPISGPWIAGWQAKAPAPLDRDEATDFGYVDRGCARSPIYFGTKPFVEFELWDLRFGLWINRSLQDRGSSASRDSGTLLLNRVVKDRCGGRGHSDFSPCVSSGLLSPYPCGRPPMV